MDTKLRCLLLDDELPGLTYLKMLCEQITDLEVVRSFNNPETFLKENGSIDYDLCILDIEMPGINGVRVAQSLRDKLIIFTTAYKEYAADAFDIDAVDYIRKPVTGERLHQAIAKAKMRIEKSKAGRSFVQLNTDKGKALVYFDQVAHLTTAAHDSRDKTAWMTDGSSLVLKNISFEKLLSVLPAADFCRLTKKDVIAMKNVSYFVHNQVTITLPGPVAEKRTIAISEAYRDEFVKRVKL